MRSMLRRQPDPFLCPRSSFNLLTIPCTHRRQVARAMGGPHVKATRHWRRAAAACHCNPGGALICSRGRKQQATWPTYQPDSLASIGDKQILLASRSGSSQSTRWQGPVRRHRRSTNPAGWPPRRPPRRHRRHPPPRRAIRYAPTASSVIESTILNSDRFLTSLAPAPLCSCRAIAFWFFTCRNCRGSSSWTRESRWFRERPHRVLCRLQQQSFERVTWILCACDAGADLVTGGVAGEDPEDETGVYGLSNETQNRAHEICSLWRWPNAVRE